MKEIRSKINRMPYGSVFTISDFTNITEYQNAKKCLTRLEKEGIVRRIARGIYDKQYFSRTLNEYTSPNIESVAYAIARNNNWKLAASGKTALNLLNLSTQVPYNYEYYSSGQYKTYKIGNISIHFKHKSSKELLGLSYKSSLVVQAIKELGQKISELDISKIRNGLSIKERKTLLNEAAGVTKWVYEIIKIICEPEYDEC